MYRQYLASTTIYLPYDRKKIKPNALHSIYEDKIFQAKKTSKWFVEMIQKKIFILFADPKYETKNFVGEIPRPVPEHQNMDVQSRCEVQIYFSKS